VTVGGSGGNWCWVGVKWLWMTMAGVMRLMRSLSFLRCGLRLVPQIVPNETGNNEIY